MMKPLLAAVFAVAAARAAQTPPDAGRWIETLGGDLVRGPGGAIVEVSLARTWATDNDVSRVAEIKGLKRLDLSFTYVTDRGIEKLQQLQELEELKLDTAEFLTDGATNYLRANRRLRKLVLRGVDITDVGLPHLATLTNLRSLDLSHTMIGDVGIESLPALAELEELNLSATRITGLNFHFLKLLPKLRKLSFGGIQRRNGGACWTPTIIDLDLDPIALLPALEELHLGVGVGLGKSGKPAGERNCRLTGGIQITDLGLAKLARLKNLRRLDVSGARVTAAGLEALKSLPRLERLNLWNCAQVDDSAAAVLAGFPSLVNLDLSETPAGDAALSRLAALPKLKYVYLTDTRVTPTGVEAFQGARPGVFVSWAERPKAPGSAK